MIHDLDEACRSPVGRQRRVEVAVRNARSAVVADGRVGPEAADREAYAHFRGNVAAVTRARCAVIAGRATAAGAPIPEFLVTGRAQVPAVALRTLQRAFAQHLRAGTSEHARRDADVFRLPPSHHRMISRPNRKHLEQIRTLSRLPTATIQQSFWKELATVEYASSPV